MIYKFRLFISHSQDKIMKRAQQRLKKGQLARFESNAPRMISRGISIISAASLTEHSSTEVYFWLQSLHNNVHQITDLLSLTSFSLNGCGVILGAKKNCNVSFWNSRKSFYSTNSKPIHQLTHFVYASHANGQICRDQAAIVIEMGLDDSWSCKREKYSTEIEV